MIILGRDVLLSLSAFYIRYASLPAPVHISPLFPCLQKLIVASENIQSLLGFFVTIRGSPTYTDQQGLSVFRNQRLLGMGTNQPYNSQVNTALQLVLMAQTTVTPILPAYLSLPVEPLQCVILINIHTSPRQVQFVPFRWIVAGTTIWSGLSYLFTKDAVRIVSENRKNKTPMS